MDYLELVQKLREQCNNMDCGNCNTCIKLDAADTIEKLLNTVKLWKDAYISEHDARIEVIKNNGKCKFGSGDPSDRDANTRDGAGV